ncbi:fermentation-respiration switch protein FrsA (DUF1100 family) [Chryseobacterium defluvii]|uniref:Fermentation-respiration switch protein FrsA (DUF1100 family) n=1 Tax=Chryseobacterium defluvii TaxID=160396 RepID=A0A840KCY4_9FLAO|nr:alpha/beta hydrolase [Chryseobacterium defluvii]MBB4805644.1 fermentation-respiration switch protein FrsA (DUF1100 family) [Chryseobacterium defluvii]
MTKWVHFLQEKLIFLPVKLPEDYAYDFPKKFKEYFFETPNSGVINALHFKVKNPKGVILFFHGNADNLVRWGAIASNFTDYDHDVLVMDYRHYGKSKGERSENNLYADAQFCYDFVKKKYGEENIIVYGVSLGGAFAIKMAAENEPKLLIVEATFYNLKDMVNRWIPKNTTEKITTKMTYDFRSDEHIIKVNCPVYHFHGDKDLVVPIKSGKKLFNELEEKRPEVPKKFIEIKKGSHNDLSNFEQYHHEMKEIFSIIHPQRND